VILEFVPKGRYTVADDIDATPLWTGAPVADLIERDFRLSYHTGYVWKQPRQLKPSQLMEKR
jgi:hypothetical protein